MSERSAGPLSNAFFQDVPETVVPWLEETASRIVGIVGSRWRESGAGMLMTAFPPDRVGTQEARTSAWKQLTTDRRFLPVALTLLMLSNEARVGGVKKETRDIFTTMKAYALAAGFPQALIMQFNLTQRHEEGRIASGFGRHAGRKRRRSVYRGGALVGMPYDWDYWRQPYHPYRR